MSKYIAFFVFASLGTANIATALACSPPNPDIPSESASVSSGVPAKVVPKGAIQLKIEAQDYGAMREAIVDVGKITLPVEQVLAGKFSDSFVRLNTTNVDHCNSSFEPQTGGFFVTVIPMEYSDGEPVLDKVGNQEFGALFYKSHYYYPPEEGTKPEGKKASEFAEYSPITNFSFYDLEKIKCFDAHGEEIWNPTPKVWRRCVGPGEYVALDCEQKKEGKLVCKEDEDFLSSRPAELRRGYSFWVHHQTKISSILLAMGLFAGLVYFFRSRKLHTS